MNTQTIAQLSAQYAHTQEKLDILANFPAVGEVQVRLAGISSAASFSYTLPAKERQEALDKLHALLQADKENLRKQLLEALEGDDNG